MNRGKSKLLRRQAARLFLTRKEYRTLKKLFIRTPHILKENFMKELNGLKPDKKRRYYFEKFNA